MKRILVITLALLTLGGCATVPMASKEMDQEAKQFTPPPEGNAGIYVFRDSALGGALKKTIWIDGEVLGESAPSVYFYRLVSEGKHTLSTESEFSPNDLIVDAESGQNYFIENYIKMGLFVGGAGLELVDPEEGMKRVLKTKLAE